MKAYKVSYRAFFRGQQTVEVLAENKAQAIEVARETKQYKRDAYGGNVEASSCRVVAQRALDKDKWKAVSSQDD